MAEEILFGIAEEILKNLASRPLDEIALAWGFKDRLDKLHDTVNTIKCVLLDAEEKQADSHAIRNWLQKLATIVYDADDLFDEVATIASRKQIMGGNKLSRRVRTFFSSSNQVMFAFSVSRKIKTIREKLDAIVKDSTEFAFVHRPHEEESVINALRGRDKTHSYVDANEVIGRDVDKEAILKSLLACNELEDKALQVISIVGIGGQGKTTLAQYIYNDSQVAEYFELRLWVCVSEDFNIKVITEKILELTSDVGKGLEMEKLQGLLRNKLNDKRYLLVLDDVWNEEREKWLELEALLKNGIKGSKILVTTRSREVASIMGTHPPHELEGLSQEKSWELFEKLAFTPRQLEQKPPLIMMEAGKEIIKKCANVPLAVRSVASLLYGKDESRWISFKNRSLANIFDGQKGVMDILKLSYQHLPSPLKNCFAYCALYPKDYEFDKENLIDLWMAEGFIVPTNQEAQLEELAEDYFFVLLQRCFFQDMKEDEIGNIKSCKMHDLVHDLAQEIARHKCKVAESEGSNSERGIRHLSFAYSLTSEWEIPSWMLNWKALRTLLLPQQVPDGRAYRNSVCQELNSSFRCLRVLDLHGVSFESLPSSIDKLIHLRYLNISHTFITKLPDSIIKLYNLQTLRLNDNGRLNALPRDIRKLGKLRILDVHNCQFLNHLPSGLGELTSLTKLPFFIVNTHHSPMIESKHNSAKLSDLRTLDLRGDLHIQIKGELKNPLSEAAEANLCGKHRMTELWIELESGCFSYKDDSRIDHDEGVLEGLKPNSDLKVLKISYYRGRKLPCWAMNSLCNNFPNLVKVELAHCSWCEQVPSFGQLPFLKRLSLLGLESVEYMEMDDLSLFPNSSSMEPFFPSLENLTLKEMINLKGWWKVEVTDNNDDDTKQAASHKLNEERCLSMSFPKLSSLQIESCPELISLPLCPNVEDLLLIDVNESISLKMGASSASKHGLSKLHKELESGSFSCEDGSRIDHDDGVLEGLKQDSNLKTLKISDYRGLKLPRWAMNNLCINLPKLVKVELHRCYSCEQIPSFGQLPFLMHLSLVGLGSVEYMEMEDLSLFSSSMEPFFPSLEILTLKEMRNLKGWWKVGEMDNDDDTKEAASHQLNEERCLSMSFPKLSHLQIERCPELISLPLCPNVEALSLFHVNQSISVMMGASSASTSTSRSGPKLRTLTVNHMRDLTSLPRECLHHLSVLNFYQADLVSTDQIEDEVFKTLSSSLCSLKFHDCDYLRSLGQGLEHLTAMEKLVIWNCGQLDLSQNEEVPWRSFINLRSLELHEVHKMLSLPSGLQHLTNLRSLRLGHNNALREVPEWISCFSSLESMRLCNCGKLTSLPDGFCKLTALKKLDIDGCGKLTEHLQAQHPYGAEWLKIKHIPFLSVREYS